MIKRYLQLSLLSLFIISCGNDNSSNNSPQNFQNFAGNMGPGQRATSVEAQQVESGSIAEQVRSFGNVKAQNVVSIVPQVSNRITQIYVDLGDTVSRGQALAKILDNTFRDNLNQAESQVQQAEIALRRDSSDYNRQLRLMERDLSSESELFNAEAAYQNSRAQYESALSSLTQARENFENTVVRSPVDGVITSRALEVGDLASTGTEMFQVASTGGYESRIFLPAQDWKAVNIGHEVMLRLSNDSDISARGMVSRKSPQLDATTGLGEVVITITDAGDTIYPGILTENIINITTKERTLIVPRSALVEQVETVINPESNTIDLERTYSVFVSRGDSIAERRELELGIEQGEKIEVLNGLLPNDKIIITGQSGLEDGARISVASGERFRAPQERQIGNQENQNQPGPSGDNNPLANMSEQERAEAREKMQNMSPEERRDYLQQLRDVQSDSTSK